MRFYGKTLNHLPVENRSGDKLGRIVDFEMDPENHQIVVYVVRPSRLTSPLVKSDLRISDSQVVSLTAEKMVVEDNVKPAVVADSRRSRPRFLKEASPALPRQ